MAAPGVATACAAHVQRKRKKGRRSDKALGLGKAEGRASRTEAGGMPEGKTEAGEKRPRDKYRRREARADPAETKRRGRERWREDGVARTERACAKVRHPHRAAWPTAAGAQTSQPGRGLQGDTRGSRRPAKRFSHPVGVLERAFREFALASRLRARRRLPGAWRAPILLAFDAAPSPDADGAPVVARPCQGLASARPSARPRLA